MPDYSKVSDEELLTRVSKKKRDYSKVSDDELLARIHISPPPEAEFQTFAKDVGRGAVRGLASGVEGVTTAVPSFLGKVVAPVFETPEETAKRENRMAAIAKLREGQDSPSTFVGRHIAPPVTPYGEAAQSVFEAAPSSVLQPGGPLTKAATTLGIGLGGYAGEKGADLLGIEPGYGKLAGGVIGGVVSGGSAQLSAERRARGLLPTAEANARSAKAAFDAIKNAGLVIEPTEAQNFAAGLRADLEQNLFSAQPGGRGSVGFQAADLIEKTNGDLATLMNIHSKLGSVKPSEGPNYAAALHTRDAIREFIANLQPNQVVRGDPQFISSMWQQARDTWRTQANLEDIQNALNSAEWRRQASGRGTNLNTMRQEIRKIIDNSNKARRFTPEAREEMERLVEGDAARNILRRIAAFAPHGSVSSFPTLAITAMEGSGAGAAFAVSTGIIHRLQHMFEDRAVAQLQDVIRLGSPLVTRDIIDQRDRLLLTNRIGGGRVGGATGRGALAAGAGSPLAADQPSQ